MLILAPLTHKNAEKQSVKLLEREKVKDKVISEVHKQKKCLFSIL